MSSHSEASKALNPALLTSFLSLNISKQEGEKQSVDAATLRDRCSLFEENYWFPFWPECHLKSAKLIPLLQPATRGQQGSNSEMPVCPSAHYYSTYVHILHFHNRHPSEYG